MHYQQHSWYFVYSDSEVRGLAVESCIFKVESRPQKAYLVDALPASIRFSPAFTEAYCLAPSLHAQAKRRQKSQRKIRLLNMWKISKVKAPLLLFILGIQEILHFGKITITFLWQNCCISQITGFIDSIIAMMMQ